MYILIAVITSYLLSVLLNKVSENKGWKTKAVAYADKNPGVKNMPTIIGGVLVVAIFLLSYFNVVSQTILIPILVITVTIISFLFALFRDI